MMNLQKAGGVASLLMATSYLIGFWLYFSFLDASGYTGPVRQVEFLIETQAIQHIGNLVIYVAASLFLLVLVLALHELLKDVSSSVMQIATALGLIWVGVVLAAGMVFNIGMETVVSLYGKDPAFAASVWYSVYTVHNGLGGGTEIVGGIWLLLISWAAWKKRIFSAVLNAIGVIVGLAGILSIIPGLGEMGGMIFGLGQIVWFLWLGAMMLRTGSTEALQNQSMR